MYNIFEAFQRNVWAGIRVLLTKCGPYKTYTAGLNTPD